MRIERKMFRAADSNAISVGSIIVLVLSLLVFANAQDDTRITATWQVQKYEITATLPASEQDRNLSVKATLILRNVSPRPATSLTLRISPNAVIASVAVNSSTVDFARSEEKLGSTSLQRIAIRIPSTAAGSNISAVVDYGLAVKENSGLSAVSNAGTQFLPLSFWYPTPNSWYFARGADYASVRLQVNSHGKTVVASGKESAGLFEQGLMVQPFFIAGSFERSTLRGIEVFLPSGASPEEKQRADELAALMVDARNFITNAFGAGPDTPLRIVSVKRGGGFSSGGTLLVDEAVFRRAKLDSGTATAAGDAVAKLWFADSVQLSGDGNGAVREGLSRYVATQFIEHKFGKSMADIERARQRNAYLTVSQRDAPIIQVAPLDDYYYSTVAYKGAMAWRLLSRRVGADEFNKRVRMGLADKVVTLAELRGLFAEHKDLADAMFDRLTDTNLMIGLPQSGAGETRAALRNTGAIDVTVAVTATFATGEKMSAPTTIRANSFGEIAFRSPNKVVKLEIDSEKLYPQIDYSDDIAPREFSESDLLLAVKRAFDKQDYSLAETTARKVLADHPNFDDVRVLYARSLLALNRTAEAEREFRIALDEKFPTARTIAWSNLGLGEVANRSDQNAVAIKFAEDAIRADADFGASYGARLLRNRVKAASAVPEEVRNYFTAFDRAALTNRKAEIDAWVVGGEASRFVNGISGQVVEWKSQVTHVDQLGTDLLLVEAQMSVKLLTRQVETGIAVYRLLRTANGLRLYSVDTFEVR